MSGCNCKIIGIKIAVIDCQFENSDACMKINNGHPVIHPFGVCARDLSVFFYRFSTLPWLLNIMSCLMLGQNDVIYEYLG